MPVPMDGPVRTVAVLPDGVYIGGGLADGQGFVAQFLPDGNTVQPLAQALPAPLHQLTQLNGRYVCLFNQTRIEYTYDFAAFDQFYYGTHDGIPTLHQQPYRDAVVAAAGDVFLVSGGGLRFGTIQKSGDTLKTWSRLVFSHELRCLSFPTAQVGFAGGFGALYKTTDAGAAWKPLPLEGHFLTGLHFADETHGLACTFEGRLLRTQDGGESWKVVHRAGRAGGEQVFFALTPLADGRTVALGRKGLLVSENGTDWSRFSLPHEFEGTCMAEVLPNTLLIGGENAVLRVAL